MIRIGILGAAKIGPKAVLRQASRRQDCTITAVASRDGDKAKAYAEQYGIPAVETDYLALVEREDVDLVYNALPPHRHADLTIAALEAGKAVLCEKPFAMNTPEAVNMVTAAHRTGQTLIEAFHYRFHPAFQMVLDIIRREELGALHTLEGIFDVEIPYREGELRHTLELGGGALMDLGCYPLHMVRTLAGAEPRVLSAEAVCERDGVDLSMKAQLGFPGGVKAKIQTSMAPGVTRQTFLRAECADGSIEMTNPVHPQLGHEITIHHMGKTRIESVPSTTTYDHQLAHVLNVMRGRAAPLTGGADAVGNMSAIDAIYVAAGLNPRG